MIIMEIYKIMPNGKDKYLGFLYRDVMPNKGETMYFLGHIYEIMDTRENCVFVKFMY